MSFASLMLSLAPDVWFRQSDVHGGSGTMLDSSGNGRDGADLSITTGGASLLVGDSNGSKIYPGTGGFSYVNVAGWMAGASGAFSCHAIINSTRALNAIQEVLCRYNGNFPGSQFAFRLDNDKLAAYIFSGSGFGWCNGATTLVTTTTYCIGMSYDGTNARVYLNGLLDGTSGNTGSNSSTEPLMVGIRNVYADERYTGLIDEVAYKAGAVWSAATFAALNAAARGLSNADPIIRRPLRGLIVR